MWTESVAKNWKQAIALTPGNYTHNWSKRQGAVITTSSDA